MINCRISGIASSRDFVVDGVDKIFLLDFEDFSGVTYDSGLVSQILHTGKYLPVVTRAEVSKISSEQSGGIYTHTLETIIDALDASTLADLHLATKRRYLVISRVRGGGWFLFGKDSGAVLNFKTATEGEVITLPATSTFPLLGVDSDALYKGAHLVRYVPDFSKNSVCSLSEVGKRYAQLAPAFSFPGGEAVDANGDPCRASGLKQAARVATDATPPGEYEAVGTFVPGDIIEGEATVLWDKAGCAPTLSVLPQKLGFPYSAATQSVRIRSNDGWEIEEASAPPAILRAGSNFESSPTLYHAQDVAWPDGSKIRFFAEEFRGDQELRVESESNPTYANREKTLHFRTTHKSYPPSPSVLSISQKKRPGSRLLITGVVREKVGAKELADVPVRVSIGGTTWASATNQRGVYLFDIVATVEAGTFVISTPYDAKTPPIAVDFDSAVQAYAAPSLYVRQMVNISMGVAYRKGDTVTLAIWADRALAVPLTATYKCTFGGTTRTSAILLPPTKTEATGGFVLASASAIFSLDSVDQFSWYDAGEVQCVNKGKQPYPYVTFNLSGYIGASQPLGEANFIALSPIAFERGDSSSTEKIRMYTHQHIVLDRALQGTNVNTSVRVPREDLLWVGGAIRFSIIVGFDHRKMPNGSGGTTTVMGGVWLKKYGPAVNGVEIMAYHSSEEIATNSATFAAFVPTPGVGDGSGDPFYRALLDGCTNFDFRGDVDF